MLDPIQMRLAQVIHQERLQEAMEAQQRSARPIGLGLIERMRSALSVPVNQPVKLTHPRARKAHS